MSKSLRYFLLGNIYAVAGILFAIVLINDKLDLTVGLSHYTTQLASALPFSAGLLALAAYNWLALKALPEDFSDSFRVAWGLMIACTIGLALAPFGFNRWLFWSHLVLAYGLFFIKLGVVICLALSEKTRRGWVLLVAAAVSLVTAGVYWAAVLDSLMIGQIIFQVVFFVIIVDAFWRYGKAPTLRPKRHVALAQKGFTIVELMIATTVFSLVLLMLSFGLVQIGRTYNKGVTSARTQEAARSIMDEISRAIQFSGGTIATTPAQPTDGVPYVFCIDDKRYSVVTDRQIKDSPEDNSQVRDALVVDSYPGCNASTSPLSIADRSFVIGNVPGARELVPTNMRVAHLSLTNPSGNLYQITIRIVAGEDDLLDNAHDNCQNVRAGTQFCAVSELTTVVQKRL